MALPGKARIKIKSSTPLDGNSGLQQWATKENLKIAAQAYNAMQSQNISTLTELIAKIDSIREQNLITNESIIQIEKQVKELAEIMKYFEQYQQNLLFHEQYERAKNKDSVFQKYESQIILFGGAERMLKQSKINPKITSFSNLKIEYEKLIHNKNILNKESRQYAINIRNLESIKQTMDDYYLDDLTKQNTIFAGKSLSKDSL